MEKGNTALLTVIGVATLLVALVGATFAYFTATLSNESAQSISVTTATPVGLEYEGSSLLLPNAMPGDSAGLDEDDEITFTVLNPSNSSVAQTYDLNLIIDENEFTYTEQSVVAGSKDAELWKEKEEQLVVAIQASSDNENTELQLANLTNYNLTDGADTAAEGKTLVVVADQRIEIGETQTYTISIEFKELGYPQDNNQNVNFSAHIEISDAVSVQ